MIKMFILLLLGYVASASTTGSVVMNSTVGQSLTVTVIPDSNSKTGGHVNIVFSGSTQGWYAVGFNNTDMTATYSIVVDYSGIIYEYYLGHGTCSPGCDTLLKPTYYVNSNMIDANLRIINITRPIADDVNGAEYFVFPTAATDLQLIWAWGVKGQMFQEATAMGYHGECKINLK
eukprot:108053_1